MKQDYFYFVTYKINDMSRKEAIELAKVFNLDKEVAWCIDFCGYTPEQALYEWDII